MSQTNPSPPTQQTPDSSALLSNHSNPTFDGLGSQMSSDANHSSGTIIGGNGGRSNGGQPFSSHTFTLDQNSSNNSFPKNISAPSNDWYRLPQMDNFVDILTLCCSTAVIVGSLIPYIPQYLKIKRSLSSDGFSTYGKIS